MTKERARVLLAEYAKSSETVKAFCERVGMHTWQFYYWRRRCAEEAERGEHVGFVPLEIKTEALIRIRLRNHLEFECTSENLDLVARLLHKLSETNA